jgi:hypothetical protein
MSEVSPPTMFPRDYTVALAGSNPGRWPSQWRRLLEPPMTQLEKAHAALVRARNRYYDVRSNSPDLTAERMAYKKFRRAASAYNKLKYGEVKP